jgi:hypothetical protein
VPEGLMFKQGGSSRAQNEEMGKEDSTDEGRVYQR